jgi:mannose-1-phosphate guanylyltransferase
MIDWVIDAASEIASEVIVAANYGVEALKAHVRGGGARVTVVAEEVPLGTAGAVRNVADHLEGTFLVLNGDVITAASLAGMVQAHEASRATATIGLTQREDTSGFGVAVVDDSMEIQRFVEKPPPGQAPSDLVNAGVYILEEEVLDLIPSGREVSLEREVFPELAGRGLKGHILRGAWSDAGTLTGYLSAQALLLESNAARPGSRADVEGRLVPPVLVPSDATVEASTLGPNVSIGSGCLVTGATVREAALFDDVRVEEDATVVGSLLGDAVHCPRGAVVRNSIVGDGYRIPQGSRVQGQRLGSDD